MDLETKTMSRAVSAVTPREGKYLTFSLADEEYGIGIKKIKEIIGMVAITPIPQTPAYVKGVINLRGKVIPVVDLRLKFDMQASAYNERTCIIVLEITTHNSVTMIGMVVDSVSEVLNIKAEDIEDAPHINATLDTAYILGMAKSENAVKILLDIDNILKSEDIAVLRTAA